MASAKSEKQKLSELRRLEALKQRRFERNSRQRQITLSLGTTDGVSQQNKKIVFHSDEEDDHQENQGKMSDKNIESTKDKLMLFESSDSENDDDEVNRFEIKTQFQGEKGKQLFEMSSGFTDDRFKLDERFKEDDEMLEDADSPGSPRVRPEEELAAEKEKNLEILERVLGFQVPKKPLTPIGEKRKQIIRFDPESEDASKFFRKPDSEDGKKEKTKSKKGKAEKAPPSLEPEVSGERYFEVVDNLKEILGGSAPSQPFSFKHQFNFQGARNEDESCNSHETKKNEMYIEEETAISTQSKEYIAMPSQHAQERVDQVEKPVQKRIQRRTKFFLDPDDPRLKDGVEDFRRTLSMEEIKKNWLVNRDTVLELFRKNRRFALKNPKPKSRGLRQMSRQRMKHRKFNRR